MSIYKRNLLLLLFDSTRVAPVISSHIFINDGNGKIPPVADIKSGGPLADAAACEETATDADTDNRSRYGRRLSAVIARRQRDTAARSSDHANRFSDPAVPLVLDGIAVATADVTHVPIGRIKLTCLTTLTSKSDVATNAWPPQASYPCGNFSDISRRNGALRSERIDGPRFRGPYSYENRDRASFCNFARREVSVLAELALGHLRYTLTDVLPQSNSLPGTVPRLMFERGPQSCWSSRRWRYQEGRRVTGPLFHRMSEEITEVVVFQVRCYRTTPVTAKAGKTGTRKAQRPNEEIETHPTEKKTRAPLRRSPPPAATAAEKEREHNPLPNHNHHRHRQRKPRWSRSAPPPRQPTADPSAKCRVSRL
ncbi:unnamed protein product [Acanthosepion pharaonis]|uniref:Uncharacterized protein n=1 Tax=Acanthosepion pharaonis TaxID=158019 RepID=A0A812BFB6_ACAPH|nr:unnamed protein product [Sepia pharaonis]